MKAPSAAIILGLAPVVLSAYVGTHFKKVMPDQRDSSLPINLSSEIDGTPASPVFNLNTTNHVKLQGGKVAQIFTLMCTSPGFKGDCLVFGTAPGVCASFVDFDKQTNSTNFTTAYDHKVSSIATNTGGACMFFRKLDCDKNGDDAGLTTPYQYDLDTPENGYLGDWGNNITSWRC